MADLTANTPSRTASDIAANQEDGAAAITFANTGKEFLLVDHTNAGGSASNLTIATTLTIDGGAVADKVVAISAGEKHLVGPFPTNIYNDDDDEVNATLDGGYADITITLIRPA